MAKAKAKTATQKTTSSDEQIKDFSLYHTQGRGMRLEGMNFLSWLQRMNGKQDDEILAEVKKAARHFRLPKVALKLAKFELARGDDGEMLLQDGLPQLVEIKHLVDVPLTPVKDAAGVYDLQYPNIYKHDGPTEYEVCGTQHKALSWPKELHDEWNAYKTEEGLDTAFNEMKELEVKIADGVPSSQDLKAMEDELPGLIDTRTGLVAKQNAAYGDLDVTEEQIDRLAARVKLVNARIDFIQSEQRRWRTEHDPFEVARRLSPDGERMKVLERKLEAGYFGFVHRLALRGGLTRDDLGTWEKRATKADFDNAQELVAEGNASWTSRANQARPMTREDHRRVGLQKLFN